MQLLQNRGPARFVYPWIHASFIFSKKYSRQLSEVGVKETSFEANRLNVNSLFLV